MNQSLLLLNKSTNKSRLCLNFPVIVEDIGQFSFLNNILEFRHALIYRRIGSSKIQLPPRQKVHSYGTMTMNSGGTLLRDQSYWQLMRCTWPLTLKEKKARLVLRVDFVRSNFYN